MDLTHSELPIGLNMALAQNLAAMEYFASLSKEGQKKVIDEAHHIHSKKEMQVFVDDMSKRGR